MTVVFGLLLILAVAAAVASPLLARGTTELPDEAPAAEQTELFEREKNVALLAIREAEFDLAMGKLSDEDYAALRGVYEERALGALGELDAIHENEAGNRPDSASKSDSSATGAFCTRCGAAFEAEDRFCGVCGAQRRPA